MASGAGCLRLIAGLVAFCGLAVGCARGGADVAATWTVEPAQPSIEAATLVRIALAQGDGTPLSGGRLRLEAHMSHPGMAPVVGEMIDRGRGLYESRVKLTMAGPWVLAVSGELPGGQRIVKQTEVTAVQRAR